MEFRERCNKFGASKVRILAAEDFNVIFGSNDGPVTQLHALSVSFASALDQYMTAGAPICYLAACIEQYMAGNELSAFSKYLKGLAARQVGRHCLLVANSCS